MSTLLKNYRVVIENIEIQKRLTRWATNRLFSKTLYTVHFKLY